VKGLILSIIVISGLSVLTSNAFAENLFYGSSSFEGLHSMTPGMSSGFEIKMQYTAGPYQIGKLSPVFDVSPKDAASYVQIKANPLDGLSRNDVGRIQGTMSVDSQIPYDSVFVTVYFEGLDSYDNTYKSAWTDSITVDVKRTTPPEKNMSYSQFLDFCNNHDPTLWDFMSIDERQLSNLCGLSNIGERQWAWLNGTALDWRNFAQKSAEEYAVNIPLYDERGINGTLVVETIVSGRDSFPPPMTGGISFSYDESGRTGHYSSRIMVGFTGIDETKYVPFGCKHQISGASFGRPLDLQYGIRGGALLDLCKNDDTNSVIAKIDAGYDGEITLTIPKKVVYSLTSTDCADDSELIILFDNEEILATKSTHSNKDNVITVTFPRGHHTIEFIGASIMPDPSPVQYCGIVMGLDSLYLPPKFQVERGMKMDQVKCNAGLYLIHNPNGSHPACVRETTLQKLVERGWKEPPVCHGCGVDIFDTAEMPSDFGIVYSFGIGGKNIFDTKKMSYTKDMVCAPSVTILQDLTHSDLFEIWDSTYKNGFFELHNFTDNCSADGICKLVTPEQTSTITVTSDGKIHTVTHRDSYVTKTGDDYTKFQNIVNAINAVLDRQAAIQGLPGPTCAYQ